MVIPVSALNTNISFYPDVSETNSSVSLNDIYIRFNISYFDIANQIPDQVVVLVQVCFKFRTLYCYDPTTYPGYLEYFGTWQQTFLNPFNESVSLNVFDINTSKDIIYLYGKIISGYTYDASIKQIGGQTIAQDLLILNFSNTSQPLPTLTPTPTPAPTTVPVALPTQTSNPNISGTTDEYSTTVGDNYTTWANGVVSSYNSSISSIFSIIDYPFAGMRTGIQSINSSLNNSTYNLSMSFLVVVVPPVINAIPTKIKALISLYLIFLVILIILGV